MLTISHLLEDSAIGSGVENLRRIIAITPSVSGKAFPSGIVCVLHFGRKIATSHFPLRYLCMRIHRFTTLPIPGSAPMGYVEATNPARDKRAASCERRIFARTLSACLTVWPRQRVTKSFVSPSTALLRRRLRPSAATASVISVHLVGIDNKVP